MGDLQGRKVFKVFNQDFVVDERYNVTKELGQGAYGIVCAATNSQTDEGVAIKKVTNVFSKKILAKRALREIKLLQHFRGHRNITCLYDMDIPRPDNFNETYLYEELMECDLAAIIRSGQPLTDAHFQSFIYQILCGLKYIHSANVLHRDLKPGNLLVNADCELKICDFGLARGFSMDPEENAGYMTEYVATRWYRAPEIMLSFQSYTKAIDVWSVGCILAELLGSRPFFKGRDYVDQLNQILHYLGTPNEETLSRIGSPRAQEYVRNLPFMPKVPFQRLFNNANPDALDLLDRMLAFDPSSRITVEVALEHRYLQIWHDASDEPACPTTFDFAFEVVEEVPQMRQMILAEVQRFRQHVRVQQPQAQMGGPIGQAQTNVPIPDKTGQWSHEDPRPQEAGIPQHMGKMGLEQELQGGLDMLQDPAKALQHFCCYLSTPTTSYPEWICTYCAPGAKSFDTSDMEATITLTPLGCLHDNVARVFILNPRKMHIDVGRASKNTTKGLFAGKFNAWFDSPIMSREHARIVLEPTGLKLALIQDNGSTHGTFIKGHRLEAKVYTEVNDGDVITFGTQVTAGEHSHKPRDFRVGLEWRAWLDPSVNRPAQRELQNVFRIPNYDSESSAEDRSGDNSLEITNVRKRPAYSIPSSIDDTDSDDFEDQDLDNDLITNVTEPSHNRTLDNPTSRTLGTVIENPVTIVDRQESVQSSKCDGPPGSSQNYPIDVEDADRAEDAERESDVLEDENTSEDDEGPEILPIGQSNNLPGLANPNLSDISFTAVNSGSSNGSQCAQVGPNIDIQASTKEPVSWPAFATQHAKYEHCSAFKAPEPSVHHWSSTNGPHDLPVPHPSRYEEGPFSSAYENRFIPEVLRRPCDYAERDQLQYNFHPTTHQQTNQMAGITLGNLALENSGFHGRSKYEDTGPRVSTAIGNIDVSAPRAQSKVSDARTDYLLHGNAPSWKYSSYAERAWTPDETDNPKGSNLKISDLVHSYTDTTRGLKRKACEMSTSIEARVPTSSPGSTGSHTNDSAILQSAQSQCLTADLLESSLGICSMEISHNLPPENEDLVPNVVEGPATKKIKISSTTPRRSGKFVSGFLVGVAGTMAAAVTALISSASADVWQEALHEATHGF